MHDDDELNGELERLVNLLATGDIEGFMRHIPEKVADQRRASLIVQAAVYRKLVTVETDVTRLARREIKLWGVAVLSLSLSIALAAQSAGMDVWQSAVMGVLAGLVGMMLRGLGL